MFAEAAISGKVGWLQDLTPPGLDGERASIGIQALSIVATVAYSMIVTYVIIRVIDATVGCRVSAAEEEAGLDAGHGEQGYLIS